MTNGEHSWVFVSDERYKVILVERNYLLMAVATARRENAKLRNTVWWLLGGMVLAIVVIAWLMRMGC
jgi:hypothetical protein